MPSKPAPRRWRNAALALARRVLCGVRVRVVFASIFCAIVMCSATRAYADPASGALQLAYRAPGTCPDESAFLAGIRARVQSAHLAPDDASATRFEVTIVPTGDRWTGELVARDRERQETTRRVAGKPCEDVVDALALVAALVLDPSADPTPPPAPPAPPSAPERAAAPVAGEGRTPEPDASTERRPSRWSVAVQGDVVGAGLGSLVPRGAASVRLRALADGFIALGGAIASGSTSAQSGGRARITWTTLVLEACPLRLRASADVSVLPCIPIEGGFVLVGAEDIVNPSSATQPWLATGADVRLELSLSSWVFLDLHAGGRVPILRDTFYFRPGEDVYRAPAVIAQAGIGAGAHFP